MKRGREVKAKEEEMAKSRKERQAKQNDYYDTSAKRNKSWDKLAQERTVTIQNNEKELQSSKANVMSKMKSVWPADEKVENMTCIEFVLLLSKINNTEHKLFDDLLLLEASLDNNMDWDIFKVLVKETITKKQSA